MKRILVVRHAKSDWEVGSPDFDRPLNKRGKKTAPLIGAELLARSVVPQRILASPAQRAKSTVKRLQKGMNTWLPVTWHEEFYTGYKDDIIHQIRQTPDSEDCVMVVGHNPTLEDLVMSLLLEQTYVSMSTATVVALNIDTQKWTDLKKQSCTLEWVIRPKEIGITGD